MNHLQLVSSIALPDVRFRSEQEIKAEARPAQVMEASRIDPSIVATTHAGPVQRLGHPGESLSYTEKLDMVPWMYAIHWEVRHGRSRQQIYGVVAPTLVPMGSLEDL